MMLYSYLQSLLADQINDQPSKYQSYKVKVCDICNIPTLNCLFLFNFFEAGIANAISSFK